MRDSLFSQQPEVMLIGSDSDEVFVGHAANYIETKPASQVYEKIELIFYYSTILLY